MNIRDRIYSIREVEERLGIPRTKIRHYLDKRLITIDKDEENGYYLYRYSDLLRISQIVYYRDVLGYSIEETAEMLDAANMEDAQRINDRRARMLRASIRNEQQQLSMLEFNADLIAHQHAYRDRFSIIPCGALYSFPYAYFVMTNHPLWSIMFGASEFSFDGETVRHERMRCMIFERDLKFLPKGVFETYGREAEVIDSKMAVYAVKLTSDDVRNPSVIKPVLNWAMKHRFKVNDPIYTTWFYPFNSCGTKEHYVHIIMPLDIR